MASVGAPKRTSSRLRSRSVADTDLFQLLVAELRQLADAAFLSRSQNVSRVEQKNMTRCRKDRDAQLVHHSPDRGFYL
jgi:hypothetical protein